MKLGSCSQFMPTSNVNMITIIETHGNKTIKVVWLCKRFSHKCSIDTRWKHYFILVGHKCLKISLISSLHAFSNVSSYMWKSGSKILITWKRVTEKQKAGYRANKWNTITAKEMPYLWEVQLQPLISHLSHVSYNVLLKPSIIPPDLIVCDQPWPGHAKSTLIVHKYIWP